MNLLNKMYLKRIDITEIDKVNEFLKINIFKNNNIKGYYIYNENKKCTTDKAYSRLLGISLNDYRRIMYNDCNVSIIPLNYLYNNKKDAINKKYILSVLIINEFKTLNNFIKEQERFNYTQ